MRVIVDAFGGDNAPLEILKGCVLAKDTPGLQILLAGDEQKIKTCAAENGIDLSGMKILHAPDVIGMEDEPTLILKEKKNSSMAVGLRALREGQGDAFMTAGSTGAAVVGATILVGRIKGIKRPALAAILPTAGDYCAVVDTGANVECRPEMLTQFGLMGAIYMEHAVGYQNAKVGLLNVGTEDTKGGALQTEAYAQLSKAPLNFIGNVEAREVPRGACHVLVCDGFSGNVVVKLTEGVAGFLMSMIKGVFMRNLFSKLAALMIKSGLSELKRKLDYTEYAGAPLLGVDGAVIKSHGNSGAKVIAAAIRQADGYAKSGAVAKIAEEMPKVMALMKEPE